MLKLNFPSYRFTVVRPAIGSWLLVEELLLLRWLAQIKHWKEHRTRNTQDQPPVVISPSGHNLSAMGGCNQQNKFITES
jgi:hypothetical protein